MMKPPQREDVTPYFHFTGPARFDKAIQTLHGIVKGISADRRINEREIAAFQHWLSDQNEFATRHPFSELVRKVYDYTSDGILDAEEIADMLWCCDRLEGNFYAATTHTMQKLHAMMGGIACDSKVNVDELRKLREWLDENSEGMQGYWPFDEISSLITHVLRDGIITNEEHSLLLAFLSEFSIRGDHRAIGIPLNEVGVPINGLCAVCPEVEFSGKVFCFTGSSERLPRRKLVEIIHGRGGTFSPNVTKEIDYLVICAEGNPCWAFSCYGRKVEQAVRYRRDGCRLMLVHEADFWDATQ